MEESIYEEFTAIKDLDCKKTNYPINHNKRRQREFCSDDSDNNYDNVEHLQKQLAKSKIAWPDNFSSICLGAKNYKLSDNLLYIDRATSQKSQTNRQILNTEQSQELAVIEEVSKDYRLVCNVEDENSN